MAHTKVTKNGTQNNGTANTFSYSGSFDVFKASEVQVTLDNVALTFTTGTINESASPREYTVDYTAKTVHIGGANLTSSDNIVIQPVTDMGDPTPRATYSPGASVTSEDLNNNQLQLMRKAMEYNEQKLSSLGGTMTGNLHLGQNVDLSFEGDTDNTYETTLTVTDPTADRTITFPDTTGTVVTTGDTGTVSRTMIANDAINGDKIDNDAINSEHYAAGSIDHEHLANDIIDGDNIQDDVINSEHIVADSLDSEHYAPNSVDADALAHTSVTAGSYTATDLTVDAQGRITAAANGTIATSEIADGAVTTVKIADSTGSSDGVTTAKIATDAVTTAKIANDAVTDDKLDTNIRISGTFTVDGATTLASTALVQGSQLKVQADNSEFAVNNGSGTNKFLVDSDTGNTTIAGNLTVTGTTSLAASSIDANELASNAVTESKITDGNVTEDKLAADSVTIAKIGCEQTTISDSDLHIPTSGAVVDYVTAQLLPFGGFEAIATELAFPNTQPASGVAISISDAGGVAFNGSGTSVTGRTVGGSTVTINNAPSSLNNETLVAGVGLIVTSTGSSQIYNYHKILGKEDDIKQLSDDINDFNARYRIHAGEPSSNNDDGDLVWDTNANKMKVYDASASAWTEVTSTGDFKFLVPVDAGTTTAATFDGSDTSFDLKETTNTGSAASITNVNQLIVSLNGVIQKPNTGSYSASEEGFYLTDTDTIRFCTAPATGSTCFIIQCGSAVSIPTPGDGTVTTAKIVNGAVQTAKIADGAVDTIKIADSAVETAKIAADAITGAKIADDQINSEHYVDGSIDTAHIADGQVTHVKLANDAVDGDNISDDSINSEHYVDGSIDTAHIADAQITTAKIADEAVTLAKLEHGTSSNDGKFLRANNGADPTFETISTTPADGSITRAKLSSDVQTSIAGRNMIINGACRISQRLETGGNNTAVINDTNSNSGSHWIAFPVDRFICWSVGGGALTIQRSDDYPAGKGFQNSLMLHCTTTDTDALSQSATYYILQHRIEGYNASRLSMGQTGAKSSTLSFWVKAPAGTYGVHISNQSQNRVYLKEFTVNANQTWEYKTITFPGDTTGTWEKTTGSGIQINWNLAGGSSYQGTADAWNTSWKSHTSNQYNFMGTLNNVFRLTGIQYEVGSEATEFEHKTIAQDNADCQRYFYKHKIVDSVGPYFLQYHASHKFIHDWFPVEMRAAPSASISYNSGSGHTSYKISQNHFKAYMGSSYTDTSSYHLQSASYASEL